MSFLQPLALLGLILSLTPLIIHLLNLLRHRSQPWAATRFLFQAEKKSSQFSKIKRWLTLLLRVLALACLSLIFARPISGGNWVFSVASDSPEIIVLILDRSASMESRSETNSKSKRELAINLFKQFVKPWPDSKIVFVESVFEEPFIISDFNTLESHDFNDFTSQTDTMARMPKTLLKTLNWMEKAEVGPSKILLVSDMQKSNWESQESRFQLEKIDQILTKKTGSWNLSIAPLFEQAPLNYSIQIDGLASNAKSLIPRLTVQKKFSGSPNEVIEVQASINQKMQTIQLPLQSKQTKWQPVLPITGEPKSGWVSMSLKNDFCNSDNECFFTYELDSVPSVGVLCENPKIEIVLRSAAQGKDGKLADSLSVENLSKNDVFINKTIIQQGFLPPSKRNIVENFVLEGGTLISFPSEDENLNDFSFLKWQKLEEGNNFQIRSWLDSDSILANFSDQSRLPLSTLIVKKRKIPVQGNTLAYYHDGKAFLNRIVYGNGIIYAFSTLPSDSWSTLIDGYALVPIIQRISEGSLTSIDSSEGLECGSLRTKEVIQSRSIDRPNKKPSMHAGVYKIEGKLVAVNRPTQETVNEILPILEINSVLSQATFIQDLDTKSASYLKNSSELWISLIYLCLCLLLAEAWFGLPSSVKKKSIQNA